MKSILLVLAASKSSYELSDWITRMDTGTEFKFSRAYVAPLQLATIAGLTPETYRVQIWDEDTQGPSENNLDKNYDLVGISSYSDVMERAIAIADAFRAKGVKVVIGGAGVTADSKAARGHVDAIFLGEAETTWPQFLADWEAGHHAEVYEAKGFVDLAESPPPRWDSIANLLPGNYRTGAVQTNRGCPHTCEFCNVWLTSGRAIRTKPVHQVIEEVVALERLGMKRVFFSSDNFIGNRKHAKEVLRALIPVNSSFRHPLAFTAEITVNADKEMLQLMALANFTSAIIGIESSNLDSLKETRKRQNTGVDLAEQCRNIASHGIAIYGSMIVGFDNDTSSVFDTQFQFLQAANIPTPRLNILKAFEGTDLYTRMRNEGRVIKQGKNEPWSGSGKGTNLLFKNMSRPEVFRGYLSLKERVWDWRNFQIRIVGFIDNLHNLPPRKLNPYLQQRAESLRTVMYDIPGANAQVIDEIYAHTREHAPAMLWNVATLVMTQCYEAARSAAECLELADQILLEDQLEQAGGRATLPPLAIGQSCRPARPMPILPHQA